MNTETTRHLSHKLFIGCLMNSEIKMHLNQSEPWKQISIKPHQSPQDLTMVHYQGKDYIGLYFIGDKIPFQEIKNTESFILCCLKNYCPDASFHPLNMFIFPQVFIA